MPRLVCLQCENVVPCEDIYHLPAGWDWVSSYLSTWAKKQVGEDGLQGFCENCLEELDG